MVAESTLEGANCGVNCAPSSSTPSGVVLAVARMSPGSLVPRDPGIFTCKPCGLGAWTSRLAENCDALLGGTRHQTPNLVAIARHDLALVGWSFSGAWFLVLGSSLTATSSTPCSPTPLRPATAPAPPWPRPRTAPCAARTSSPRPRSSPTGRSRRRCA